jgi:hypothetical protein
MVHQTLDNEHGYVRGLSSIPSSNCIVVMGTNDYNNPSRWLTYLFGLKKNGTGGYLIEKIFFDAVYDGNEGKSFRGSFPKAFFKDK